MNIYICFFSLVNIVLAFISNKKLFVKNKLCSDDCAKERHRSMLLICTFERKLFLCLIDSLKVEFCIKTVCLFCLHYNTKWKKTKILYKSVDFFSVEQYESNVDNESRDVDPTSTSIH